MPTPASLTAAGSTTDRLKHDPGAIGGNGSHEFMGIAASGEAGIVYCDTCDYAADVEKAECEALPAKRKLRASFIP